MDGYMEFIQKRDEVELKKTFVITDQYCLNHAGFINYQNVHERVGQKDFQPENAERLMVLIDKNKGMLT